MQNQRKRAKKLEKKRKQRKDYERRRNINRQPPSEVKEIEKEVLTPAKDKSGNVKTDNKGNVIMQRSTRTILKRVKKVRKDKDGNDLPVVPLPKSKKHRLSKAEIKKDREAERNAIKTASGF